MYKSLPIIDLLTNSLWLNSNNNRSLKIVDDGEPHLFFSVGYNIKKNNKKYQT